MKPEETVRSYWRAWSDHDLDHLLALLAPAFVSRSSLSQGQPADKDRIAMGFKMFDKALPDLKEEIISVVADGDRVACEIVETATFTGPMALPAGVIAPTNRAYTLPVGSFFRLDAQGLIIGQRTYWDTASWARQIGVDPRSFAPSAGANDTDLVAAFTRAMTSDDIEGAVNLFAPDGEWVIMATGETFRGLDQVRELATRSVAARKHGGELGIKPTNVFTNAEGTELCWEYVHKGLVTDAWPATSAQRPAPGTTFELPIILMCDIEGGKLVKIREYFDLLTLLEPSTKHHLYS